MPYASEVRILTGVTIMTVAELRADYAKLTDNGDLDTRLRIVAVMPNLLDVLDAAIAWRESGYSYYNELLVSDAIARFDG